MAFDAGSQKDSHQPKAEYVKALDHVSWNNAPYAYNLEYLLSFMHLLVESADDLWRDYSSGDIRNLKKEPGMAPQEPKLEVFLLIHVWANAKSLDLLNAFGNLRPLMLPQSYRNNFIRCPILPTRETCL